mgnify:CR=1 FL=1
MLHKDFPGKADKSINDKEKWYNKNLATGWHYKDYNQPTYNNPYGYNSQDFNNMESLKFIINDPKRGSSFSVRVLVDGYLVFPQLVGGRYEVTVPKFRKTGEYLITAEYAAMFRKNLKLQCDTVSIKNIQAKKFISCLVAMSLAMINNLTCHNNETNTFNSILQST